MSFCLPPCLQSHIPLNSLTVKTWGPWFEDSQNLHTFSTYTLSQHFHIKFGNIHCLHCSKSNTIVFHCKRVSSIIMAACPPPRVMLAPFQHLNYLAMGTISPSQFWISILTVLLIIFFPFAEFCACASSYLDQIHFTGPQNRATTFLFRTI
jgi:hypothetical protein